MSDEEMAEDASYELVMPFVVCTSKGGPYDDAAFVAGYELGHLDRDLAVLANIGGDCMTRTLRKASMPQIHLIAMRHSMVVEPCEEDDEWMTLHFVYMPPEDIDPDDVINGGV